MYIVEENFIEGKAISYTVTEKIQGRFIESHIVTLSPRTCSCKYFAESHNFYNHFHIVLCEHWVKAGKPKSAMYGKGKNGKIITLCAGFIPVK